MSDRLAEAAPAKVNLTLHVTGKRADGYHLLDSLVVFAGIGDILHARPAETLSLEVVGPFAAGLANESDNLVLRAARLLAEHVRGAVAMPGSRPIAGAALTLEKRLPVASGIGGGSADAAAAIRLLCRMWGIESIPSELVQRLGADVPVCLRSLPVRMRGIGEVLDSAPTLPATGLLLVNPGVPLATAEVFRARQASFTIAQPLPELWPDAAALAAWLRSGTNDLEYPARRLRPEIGAVLEAIAATTDCLLARMSGSGATCFGLFPDGASAAKAALALNAPGWWCWGGAMGAPIAHGRTRDALPQAAADLYGAASVPTRHDRS